MKKRIDKLPDLLATDKSVSRPPQDPGKKAEDLPIIGQRLSLSQESYFTRFELTQYNPDELFTKKGLRTLEKMATADDTISMGLASLKMMRLSSGYEIKAASDDKIDEQIADEVADNLDDFVGSLDAKLFSILGALDMGISLHEKVWQFWEQGPWKGHVRLETLMSRNPLWYNPTVDDYNRVTGLAMISPPAYGKKLPHQKFLIYSMQKRYENVFGTARIRSLYDWWYLKGLAKAALGIIVKKYGKKTPIGMYPLTMGAGDKQKMLDTLTNLATTAAALLPDGTKLEWAEMDFSTVQGCLAIVEKADQQMTKVLLGQVMSTGTSSGQSHKGGSQAGGGAGGGAGRNANLQEQTLDMYLEFIGHDMANNAMADFIKQIVDYNYDGVMKYPKFVYKPLSQENLKDTVDLWGKAVLAGTAQSTPDDEEHIRQVLGFPARTGKTTLRPNRYKTAAVLRTAPPHEPIEPSTLPIAGYRPPTPTAPGLPAMYAESDWTPPESGDAPEEVKRILRAVYAKIRDRQSGDTEEPGKKASAARQAWGAVKAAGWHKGGDGKWKKMSEPPARNRGLTRYEQRVDFAESWRVLNTDGEDKLAPAAADVVRRAVDKLKIQAKDAIGDSGAIRRLQMPYRGELAKVLGDGLAKVAESAMSQAKKELSAKGARFAEQHDMGSLEPKEVLKLLNDKAFTMAGDVSDDVLRRVKQVMYSGVKSGKSYKDIVYDIENAIAPYIDLTQAGADLAEHRLMNVVRTNVSAAYNDARRAIFEDPDLDGFVLAYQFSAILDGDTTDWCRDMDGRIFKVSNPIWKTWAPPTWYQCRSVLVPITKVDGWDGDESDEPTVEPPGGFN